MYYERLRETLSATRTNKMKKRKKEKKNNNGSGRHIGEKKKKSLLLFLGTFLFCAPFATPFHEAAMQVPVKTSNNNTAEF